MKRILLLTAAVTLAVFTLITYNSCNGDKCKNITCGNHGTCKDGKCVCADGYSGTNCDVFDCMKENYGWFTIYNYVSTKETIQIWMDGTLYDTVQYKGTSGKIKASSSTDNYLRFVKPGTNFDIGVQVHKKASACNTLSVQCN